MQVIIKFNHNYTLCLLADITRSTKKQSEGKSASPVSVLVGKARFERSVEVAELKSAEDRALRAR